jgi:hypothetical protein
MSKKSKKRRVSNAKSIASHKSHAPSSSNTKNVAAAPPAQPGSRTSTMRSQSSFEFNPDYTYVKNDLRRIGIMAGSFFVILIALSFFLR